MAASTDVSRRRFLTVVGGGLVAVASVALWRSSGCATAPIPRTAAAEPVAYVDHNGWMVTVADKQKLNR